MKKKKLYALLLLNLATVVKAETYQNPQKNNGFTLLMSKAQKHTRKMLAALGFLKLKADNTPKNDETFVKSEPAISDAPEAHATQTSQQQSLEKDTQNDNPKDETNKPKDLATCVAEAAEKNYTADQLINSLKENNINPSLVAVLEKIKGQWKLAKIAALKAYQSKATKEEEAVVTRHLAYLREAFAI